MHVPSSHMWPLYICSHAGITWAGPPFRLYMEPRSHACYKLPASINQCALPESLGGPLARRAHRNSPLGTDIAIVFSSFHPGSQCIGVVGSSSSVLVFKASRGCYRRVPCIVVCGLFRGLSHARAILLRWWPAHQRVSAAAAWMCRMQGKVGFDPQHLPRFAAPENAICCSSSRG